MIVVTWNVNSLRARLPRVHELLERHAPDVVLLQELKCTAEGFPAEALASAGYTAVHHCGGRWAGVAILVPQGRSVHEARSGLPGEPDAGEARWVEATVDGVRFASVYVPNGRAVGTDAFAAKLDFLAAMADRAAALRGHPLVIGGDLNVAPGDDDVYDPAAFAGSTHTTDVERRRLGEIGRRGDLVDVFRHLHPSGQHFTWWDYRAGHFHKGLGMRIDAFLASRDVAERARRCGIDRDLRKGPKPSDHAPLLLELADADPAV